MLGMNKVFLMGNLGSHPQEKLTNGGKPYVQLNLATHRQYKKDDTSHERTDWHSVFVWGRQGESCLKYLEKGHPILVEGYLSSYSQQDNEGRSLQKSAINAIKVDFLPRNRGAKESLPEVELDK